MVVPSPPRLSPVVEVVAGVSEELDRPSVPAGVAVRPVSGVPAVRLPPGLDVRVRDVGAADEEAVSPKESPPAATPAVVVLVAVTAEKPPKPAVVVGAVVVPPDSPNPPKAGAGVVVVGAAVEEVASPRESPAAVVLTGAIPAENPPKPDEEEALSRFKLRHIKEERKLYRSS